MTVRRAAFAAAFAAVLALSLAAVPSHASPPVALWNGKDLSSWSFFLVDPNAKMGDVWSVRDGMIVCRGVPLGFLMTKDTFTSYRLVVEWRFAPGTAVTKEKAPNSGVFLRLNGELRGLPRTYEVQLKTGDAGDVYGFWGMKVAGDPARAKSGKNDAMGEMTGVSKAAAAEKPVGEWNRYEIVLDGPRLEVTLNGTKVNSVTAADVVAGHVGLQSEGAEVHFRKVELQPLP
jgi:hypothetical protein